MALLVQPYGRIARFLDWIMTPLMHLVSGTWEVPQQTHRWNNTKLRAHDIAWLDPKGMVRCRGIGHVRWYESLVFHIPILGGWRNYVVLSPEFPNKSWHVGWKSARHCGISRIPLHGQVRMLVGPHDVEFYGIDSATGEQRPLQEVGRGRIGEGGPFAFIPLL